MEKLKIKLIDPILDINKDVVYNQTHTDSKMNSELLTLSQIKERFGNVAAQLIDDIITGGQCMTKTTLTGIERIEPLSDEWDSVKSKMV